MVSFHDKPITVVGAVNVDICGTSIDPLLEGDSNPGKITTTLGGVGRNIADNISRLGAPVRLVTVLGDDSKGFQAEKSCLELWIDMSLSRMIPGEATSTYLCINDSDGNVKLAISDMDICRHINPEFLMERMEEINRSSLVVLDANLSEEAIECLCELCTVPIFADPVSVKKAVRMKKHLDKIFCIKPNRPEAEVLSGITIKDHADLEKASKVMLEKGVKRIFISLGGEGVYYDDGQVHGIMPCCPGKIIDTTGCGDNFMAAAVCGYHGGESFMTMARMGLTAAALCAEVKGANRTDMNMMLLEEKMKLFGGVNL